MAEWMTRSFHHAGKLWVAKFDVEDTDLLDSCSWCMGNRGYVTSTYPVVRLFHRAKLGLTSEDKVIVDHVNRDRIDNRRSNLRLVSGKENAWNVSSHSDAKHHEVGVYWNSRTERWGASISRNGHRKEKLCWSEEEAVGLARTWREQWRLTGRLD